MRFNFYSYNLESSEHKKIDNQLISSAIKKKLDIIESEIISEFLKKQEGAPGIKGLGNEIKRNKKIQAVFGLDSASGEALFKLTSHYTSYTNSIVKGLNIVGKNDIYLFVLQDAFRSASRLVDSSSKGAGFIKELLDGVSRVFNPTPNCNNYLYIVEMKGFSNYSVVENFDYSKLISKPLSG